MREQSNHMAPETEVKTHRTQRRWEKRNMKVVTARSPVRHTGPSSDRAQRGRAGEKRGLWQCPLGNTEEHLSALRVTCRAGLQHGNLGPRSMTETPLLIPISF